VRFVGAKCDLLTAPCVVIDTRNRNGDNSKRGTEEIEPKQKDKIREREDDEEKARAEIIGERGNFW